MGIADWLGLGKKKQPLPSEPIIEVPAAPTADSLSAALDDVERLARDGAVPPMVMARLKRVTGVVRQTIPRLDALGGDSASAYNVMATATDYLPGAIGGYLRLPATGPTAGRSTAARPPSSSSSTSSICSGRPWTRSSMPYAAPTPKRSSSTAASSRKSSARPRAERSASTRAPRCRRCRPNRVAHSPRPWAGDRGSGRGSVRGPAPGSLRAEPRRHRAVCRVTMTPATSPWRVHARARSRTPWTSRHTGPRNPDASPHRSEENPHDRHPPRAPGFAVDRLVAVAVRHGSQPRRRPAPKDSELCRRHRRIRPERGPRLGPGRGPRRRRFRCREWPSSRRHPGDASGARRRPPC
jgi:hypothetical protein